MIPKISFIIPVYNRPGELEELLASLLAQKADTDYEILVVEDGSSLKSDAVCNRFAQKLPLRYFYTDNQGPARARNFGMGKATGDFFISLDSDCILPSHYMQAVEKLLGENKTDAFCGADCAHEDFTPVQKAINFAMTSFLSTGGLRGGKKNITGKHHLRSYNLGISRTVFEATGGFASQRISEDIELSHRVNTLGFNSLWSAEAFVYHKRRTSFGQFFSQVFCFGRARPITSRMYPSSAKITFWFPAAFLFFCLFSVAGAFFCPLTLLPLALYAGIVFLASSILYKSLKTGVLSVAAVFVQFAGYGSGFLLSSCRLLFTKNYARVFPYMFR